MNCSGVLFCLYHHTSVLRGCLDIFSAMLSFNTVTAKHSTSQVFGRPVCLRPSPDRVIGGTGPSWAGILIGGREAGPARFVSLRDRAVSQECCTPGLMAVAMRVIEVHG